MLAFGNLSSPILSLQSLTMTHYVVLLMCLKLIFKQYCVNHCADLKNNPHI